MSFDERLAGRVRAILRGHTRVEERRMFGGLAFLRRGHMACGVLGDDLIVRVGPARYGAALKRAGARPMDFTGRPLRSMVYVGKSGTRTRAQLERWVLEAIAFAERLPAKKR